MAVRYSGDAEVRIGWDARRREYYGSVRDPYRSVRGRVPRGRHEPRSSEAYDDAAIALLEHAADVTRGEIMLERKGKRIIVSRMFQAPCPVERR